MQCFDNAVKQACEILKKHIDEECFLYYDALSSMLNICASHSRYFSDELDAQFL